MAPRKKKEQRPAIKPDNYFFSLALLLSLVQESSEKTFDQIEKSLEDMDKLVNELKKL